MELKESPIAKLISNSNAPWLKEGNQEEESTSPLQGWKVAVKFTYNMYLLILNGSSAHPEMNETWQQLQDEIDANYMVAYNSIFHEATEQMEDGGLKIDVIAVWDAVTKYMESPVFKDIEKLVETTIKPSNEQSKKKDKVILAPIQNGVYGYVDNSNAMRGLHRALATPSSWQKNHNEGYLYHEGQTGVITFAPPELSEWFVEAQEAALEALDKRFATLKNDICADVIDILFHHWSHYPYPKKRDKAAITPAQICEYRGVKPTGDNLKNAWQAMRDLRSIGLRSSGIDERLFEMSSANAPQLNLFGNEAPPEADTVFIYSPGFFLAEAIEGNPAFLAPCLQEVWKLNPKSHSVTKRLSRYLRSEWRRNTEHYLHANQPVSRFRTWAAILEEAGIDIKEWPIDKDPARVVKAVEKALETLADIQFVEYADERIYESPNLYKALPRKGYLDGWLALRVYIAPSKIMADSLLPTHLKREAQRAMLKAQDKKPSKPRKSRAPKYLN